jgi:hypothetical protein
MLKSTPLILENSPEAVAFIYTDGFVVMHTRTHKQSLLKSKAKRKPSHRMLILVGKGRSYNQ